MMALLGGIRNGLKELFGPRKDSLYYFTLHKCASTLFGNFLLKELKGLRHVDYADAIYHGRQNDAPSFEKRGFVYGPLRLSAMRSSPVYAKLIRPLSDPAFIRDKVAVFFIRDPRDILVSAYHSFGFTHGYSPVPVIREAQEALRARIRELGLDGYALEAAPSLLDCIETMLELHGACERSIILRYEDMLSRFDLFARDLRSIVDLDEGTLVELKERTRPRESEDPTNHKRSGRWGQFHEQLEAGTVTELDRRLHGVLQALGYEKETPTGR